MEQQLHKDNALADTTDPAVMGIPEVADVGIVPKIEPGEPLDETGLQYHHQEVLVQELNTIRDLKGAQMMITHAINTVLREMSYKSADDDKKYKFKWSSVSTYNLLKYCYDIGPFYGFENGKDPSLRKLEQSSFISLKWGCVWYDVLRSVDFPNKIVPTELQCKTRFKYLLEQAHSRLFIGDLKKKFVLTGVPKLDNMLEKVTRLKYEAEERKTELQKFEGQRTKRSASELMGDTADAGLTSVGPEIADLDRVGSEMSFTRRRGDLYAAKFAEDSFRERQLALQHEQVALEHERLALLREQEVRQAIDSNVKRATSVLSILGYAHDLDNDQLHIKDTLLRVLQNSLHELQK
ncbi:LANO_0A04478g1_1 [Lachancea nothofagi CBS 11611]|uniref:LANO_0A04478g1_1 n=1 Tax=Lachancea nothofagi CBS 11611 TaxID=1266666 RepID=A0A1G4IQF1_9SACH|nr:LANO_0A04478g1_1 [Lachancea nothofagi CBS 11611]